MDISKDALEVAARNVGDYGLEDRVTLYRGDLFAPLGDRRYDLIISNPPYVDAEGMAGLPRECRAEPKLAFDGGADGLDIVRRILDEASAHLTPQGGLLCEIGRGRPQLEAAYPAAAAALARYRGFRGRSVLDRGGRSLRYHGVLAFPFRGETDSLAARSCRRKFRAANSKRPPCWTRAPAPPPSTCRTISLRTGCRSPRTGPSRRTPRMLAGAKDMHYFTVDGRKIIDAAAGMWCCNAGHGRTQIS